MLQIIQHFRQVVISLCVRDAFFHSVSYFIFPVFPPTPVSFIISMSSSIFVTIPPRLPPLPQVTTSAGCFHWNIFLERLDFSCREAGLLESCANVGLKMGAGRE